MVDVVVVGAGVAGMAAAARLAKRGHQVVVCEKQRRAGGILHRVERNGFGWDAGPSSLTLPAVLRDLFRKSGRPLERYVDLQLREVARRHVFADASSVDLPTGSRGAQIRAINQGLGAGGEAWADFVGAQGAVWDLLRHEVLDDPRGGDRLRERVIARQLHASTSLETLLARSLDDVRLRQIAALPFVLAGSEPDQVPSWCAVETYVERTFGVWEAAGGLAELTSALVTRLGERGVELRLGSEVGEIITRNKAVAGVRTVAGEELPCDAVVAAVDPRLVLNQLVDGRLGSAARRAFGDAVPSMPPAITYLGLRGELPALPSEVVFHGEPLLVVTTRGSAPPGSHAWTVQLRGGAPGAQTDVLAELAARGLDIRNEVVTRLDRSPAELVAAGSSCGLQWSGWRDHARRARHLNPIPGLFLVGASTHPGASIPYVAWGAAHAAAQIDATS